MSYAPPHAPQVTEPLDVRLLPDEGLHLAEPLPREWLEAQLQEVGASELTVGQPGAVDLEVSPMGPVATRPPIRVSGRVSAEVNTACVRCLAPVVESLEAAVDVTLFPDEAPARSEEEAADEATPDEGAYEENHLDLPGILREALLLELSMNPTCADVTACDERTAAMLEEANRAAGAVADDRWAPLKEMLASAGEPGEGDGQN